MNQNEKHETALIELSYYGPKPVELDHAKPKSRLSDRSILLLMKFTFLVKVMAWIACAAIGSLLVYIQLVKVAISAMDSFGYGRNLSESDLPEWGRYFLGCIALCSVAFVLWRLNRKRRIRIVKQSDAGIEILDQFDSSDSRAVRESMMLTLKAIAEDERANGLRPLILARRRWSRTLPFNGDLRGVRELFITSKVKSKYYLRALKWYQSRASGGDVNAMYTMGSLYFRGKEIAQDYQQALEWYQKAADKGHVYAMYDLGFLYYEGKGVLQDYQSALEWFHKSADAGNTDAFSTIGHMYYEGQGVPQDYNQAIIWHKKAVDKGSGLGMINLGTMYEEGKGVAQDHQIATDWFRKAAEIGNDHAIKWLADHGVEPRS